MYLEEIKLKENQLDTVELKKINNEKFVLYNNKGNIVCEFLIEYEHPDKARISYETIEKYRNQGYATRGLKLLCDEIFSWNKIIEMELYIPNKPISEKVAKKVGFVPYNLSEITAEDYFLINPNAEQILNNKILNIESKDEKEQTEKQRLEDRLARVIALIKKQKLWQEKDISK